MKDILIKAQNHFQANLPFVLYCKPNSLEITGFFQRNDAVFEAKDCTEKGFVIAAFDGSKTYLIPESESEVIHFFRDKNEIIIAPKAISPVDTVAKNDFEILVAKGIQSIKDSAFKKVVLSRMEKVDVVDFDLIAAFQKLVQRYPSTFVYCFYHPKIGTWLGATPEQLLKVSNTDFETISLAGTQKETNSSEIRWHKKEQEEQQFVTDYIISKLDSVASRVVVTEPYSVKAGNLWHIRTDISGRLHADFSLLNVIRLLHPTPAVCGLPKESAKAFILENEQYDRSFYSGFLGELNCTFRTNGSSSDLFVNLRCMQIKGSKAHLYMGCGITKDSIPGKEWEESVNKSLTMKNIL